MINTLYLYICRTQGDCKSFNQLLKGRIYANMNKLSSNLTAFRINLFNKHTNPYGFMNCMLPSELVRALPKINSCHGIR